VSLHQPGEAVALQRVAALVEMQRWGEAASAARSVLSVEPENWKALCLLSQSLSAQNEFQGGLDAALAAISYNPDSDWPHRLASIAERCLGDGRAAITHASEAVRLSPQMSESYRVLTQALLFTGDLNGAARAAMEALNLRPNDAANHRMIGIVAFHRNELEASEAAFMQALALEPDDAVSHNEMARIALRRSQQSPQRLARSAQGFARALAADPRQTGSRNNLELVLRIFLARGAYVLFLAAWLTAICEADSPRFSPALGVVGVLVPVGFAGRFVYSLTPQLRPVLLATISDDIVLSSAVAVEFLTVAAIPVGALGDWPGVSIGAVVSSIVARGLVYSRLRGSLVRDYSTQIRVGILWLACITLACMAAVGFTVAAGGGVAAEITGPIFAVLCVLLILPCARALWQRSRGL
jgi:tetratricopeptide (TPR) repeat protein